MSRFPSYAEMQEARKKHALTMHDKDGFMWCSCACGWESDKRDCYDDFQHTHTKGDGEFHVKFHMNNAGKSE